MNSKEREKIEKRKEIKRRDIFKRFIHRIEKEATEENNE